MQKKNKCSQFESMIFKISMIFQWFPRFSNENLGIRGFWYQDIVIILPIIFCQFFFSNASMAVVHYSKVWLKRHQKLFCICDFGYLIFRYSMILIMIILIHGSMDDKILKSPKSRYSPLDRGALTTKVWRHNSFLYFLIFIKMCAEKEQV